MCKCCVIYLLTYLRLEKLLTFFEYSIQGFWSMPSQRRTHPHQQRLGSLQFHRSTAWYLSSIDSIPSWISTNPGRRTSTDSDSPIPTTGWAWRRSTNWPRLDNGGWPYLSSWRRLLTIIIIPCRLLTIMPSSIWIRKRKAMPFMGVTIRETMRMCWTSELRPVDRNTIITFKIKSIPLTTTPSIVFITPRARPMDAHSTPTTTSLQITVQTVRICPCWEAGGFARTTTHNIIVTRAPWTDSTRPTTVGSVIISD